MSKPLGDDAGRYGIRKCILICIQRADLMIQKESEYTEKIMLVYRTLRRSNWRRWYAPIF